MSAPAVRALAHRVRRGRVGWWLMGVRGFGKLWAPGTCRCWLWTEWGAAYVGRLVIQAQGFFLVRKVRASRIRTSRVATKKTPKEIQP